MDPRPDGPGGPDGWATLAHGLGGAKDLPIPVELAIAGAMAALAISFTVLALAWRTPRYDEATSGRLAPDRLHRLLSSTGWARTWQVVGLVLFGYTVWVAVWGEDLLINPFFGMFYVLLWVGLVPASLLFGQVWKALSPVRTINELFARISGGDAEHGLFAYPARLGQWPAAVGLFAFVWMELVYPHSTELGPARLWFAVYVAVMLLGGALFGRTFYENADPFEVFSSLVAKLSIWGRREGRLVLRSPLANLDTTPVRPGLLAVVAVLFGSTGFDSFRESVRWVQAKQSSGHPQLLDNLGLLAFCVGVGVIFALACMTTGVGPEQPRRELPNLFAHSMVPIIVGYFFAHYLTYFVETGQQTVILMSDPMSDGSDLLRLSGRAVDYWLSYHPSLLAVLKVLGVVTGHVLGVVAAHDRAIKLLPARHQLTGQLTLLAAMVFFTAGGLYLLFSS